MASPLKNYDLGNAVNNGSGTTFYSAVMKTLQNQGLVTGNHTSKELKNIVNKIQNIPKNAGNPDMVKALAQKLGVQFFIYGNSENSPQVIGSDGKPPIYIYFNGTTWAPLLKSKTTQPMFSMLRVPRGSFTPPFRFPTSKLNPEEIAKAVIAGIAESKPPLDTNLKPPVEKDGYVSVGRLFWLGKPRAYVYKKDGRGDPKIYVRKLDNYMGRYGNWVVTPLDSDTYTFTYNKQVRVRTPAAATTAGALSAIFGKITGVTVEKKLANAFINGFVLSKMSAVPKTGPRFTLPSFKAFGGTTKPSVVVVTGEKNISNAIVNGLKPKGTGFPAISIPSIKIKTPSIRFGGFSPEFKKYPDAVIANAIIDGIKAAAIATGEKPPPDAGPKVLLTDPSKERIHIITDAITKGIKAGGGGVGPVVVPPVKPKGILKPSSFLPNATPGNIKNNLKEALNTNKLSQGIAQAIVDGIIIGKSDMAVNFGTQFPEPKSVNTNNFMMRYNIVLTGPKVSKGFSDFFEKHLKGKKHEVIANIVRQLFIVLDNKVNSKNVSINLNNSRSYKYLAGKNDTETTMKNIIRLYVLRRIKELIFEGVDDEAFRYEPRGSFRNKIQILKLYRQIPDATIQKEVDYHLRAFAAASQRRLGISRVLPRNSYYSGNYTGAVNSANRNLRRILQSRRLSSRGGENKVNRNNLLKMLMEREREREQGRGGEGERRAGGAAAPPYEPQSYAQAEYNALKKLAMPTGPEAAPVPQQPTKLFGVSARSENRIIRNLTPTEQNVMNRAGDLAAVNRILKAAGGVSKVRQAADVLRQVPKNEALRLHLISKKAAAAVNLFGGPNKAEAAVKINKKIVSARKVKKTPARKRKTPVKAKMKTPVSPIRTKVLKNALKQVSKAKLIEIAGKSTLGIYDKARTPKKVIVNDFTKFVQKKPKPQPPKKRATVAKARKTTPKIKRAAKK